MLRTSPTDECMQPSMELELFRRCVNGATAEELLEILSISAGGDALPGILLFYLENIYTLDGEIFKRKDAQFVEDFAHMAIRPPSFNIKETEKFALYIMAYAPTVPTWSGEVLDWLAEQEINRLKDFLDSWLAGGLEYDYNLKGPAYDILLIRYADYDAIKTIVRRAEEHRDHQFLQELASKTDSEMHHYLAFIEMRGTSADAWLERLRTDYAAYPESKKIIARYTAARSERQVA